MKLFAAVLSAFVMFGVATAVPASACHWKKSFSKSYKYKAYKPYKCRKHYRKCHKRCW
jgi:hypothetical protein